MPDSLDGDHTFQAPDKLIGSPIPFRVVKPPLSDTGELLLEPSRDDVDGNATTPVNMCYYLSLYEWYLPFAIMINASNLLGSNCRIPRPRKQRRNQN